MLIIYSIYIAFQLCLNIPADSTASIQLAPSRGGQVIHVRLNINQSINQSITSEKLRAEELQQHRILWTMDLKVEPG